MSAQRDIGAYPTWNVLSWLLLFRLGLTLLLLVVFSPIARAPLMEGGDSVHTWAVLLGYGVLVLLSGLAIYARWPSKDQQVQLAVFVDILAFTLIRHLSGGVSSGLGLLPALSVAAGALLLEGPLSLLFASLATLAVIVEQAYRQLDAGGTTADFTRAGLVGLLCFGVAALARLLYRRIRRAEELAEQRRGDIEDLSKINDFIIRKMETGVIVIGEVQRPRLMNAADGNLLGRTDAVGGEPLAAIAPALARWLASGGDRGRRGRRLVRIHNRDLQPSCEVLGRDIASGAVIFLQDTQEIAHQAQQIKLAALGKLTGGIAHNIRNPLTAISHAAQLLGESAGPSADDRHLSAITTRNATRIEERVQSVLQLARRSQGEAQNLELAAWLTDLRSDWTEEHRFPKGNLSLAIDQARSMSAPTHAISVRSSATCARTQPPTPAAPPTPPRSRSTQGAPWSPAGSWWRSSTRALGSIRRPPARSSTPFLPPAAPVPASGSMSPGSSRRPMEPNWTVLPAPAAGAASV